MRIVRVLALLLAAGPAMAQEQKIDCRKAQANVELTWCAEQDYRRADRELNRIFSRVVANIDKADHLTAEQRGQWKSALREAQRNWVRFKDLDCGEVIGFEWFGGSGMGLASWGCLLGKTEARTRELKDRYDVK
jgi:uncharacterized protein YecT (DUF1311 family)